MMLIMLCIGMLCGALSVRAQSANDAAVSSAAESTESIDALVGQLPDAGYADKKALVASLLRLNAPGTRELLKAFLDGNLYYRPSDKRVFVGTESANGLHFTDALTHQPGDVTADMLESVGTNNSLRKSLRAAVAQYDVASPDVDVRKAAVAEILRSIDDESAAVLRARLDRETDSSVKTSIEEGLALVDLDSADEAVRLAAIKFLGNTLNSDVYNRLTTMITADDAGNYPEPSDAVRAEAAKRVAHIDNMRKVYGATETMFFGLSLGSVLVLSAIGLAITFGVMGVINMAHGEMMMLGAYTTYVVQLAMPNHINWSIAVAVPAAFIVAGIAGIIIERGLVRFLYGRPLETLLATFGVSLILQQVVRDVFTANNRPVETPAWMAGSWQINEALSITYNRMYVVVFALLVFIGLLIVLKRTTLGLNVRAVAQNRAMAKAMGIRTDWVDALTFGLGSGIAGVAGVALSQLTNVGPNLGQQYIVDSFMVVVFGGVGNLWGTLISGMSLGVINKVLEPYAGAVLAKILVLIFLILFIQRRPRGLFPQKGRAAEG